jgi:hypothetical protein
MSRVELFEGIRRDHRLERLSIRALAKKYKVHRRVVRQALASAVPPERKEAARRSPVMEPYEDTIRAWLIADKDVPRKQRHTARRVWARLISEQGQAPGTSGNWAVGSRRCSRPPGRHQQTRDKTIHRHQGVRWVTHGWQERPSPFRARPGGGVPAHRQADRLEKPLVTGCAAWLVAGGNLTPRRPSYVANRDARERQ